MKRYLFQKDLWGVDFLSSMIFALCMGYLVQNFADSGESYLGRLVFAAFSAVGSYVLAFIFGLLLRRKITYFRSWFWLGIVGSFFVICVKIFPLSARTHTFHDEYSGFSGLISTVILDLVIFAVNWMVWAILGLTVIFGVRLILYFCKRITGGENIP